MGDLVAQQPWWRPSELRSGVQRAERCLNKLQDTDLFKGDDAQAEMIEATFILILILLNDVLQHLAQSNRRVDFSDDIVEIDNRPMDVTDLINKMRNAACHIPSEARGFPTIRLGLLVCTGKPRNKSYGELVIDHKYGDDTTFMYGRYSIYLRRHLVRATKEIKARLPAVQVTELGDL
ncbi:hypothetical protein [Dyella sp. EPa41]|uniref:hypothetical protein n=1 Tax=Dyella sp. EPa41 TaxID=1561194 RepID=UPI0019159BDD|nr:hypothetical protein [Dyella sp. EPa41]